MATLFKTNGDTEHLTPADGARGFSLDEMYAALACEFIAVLRLSDGALLVIDEEGKLARATRDPKPINLNATALAHDVLGPGDYIVGDALRCSKTEIQ